MGLGISPNPLRSSKTGLGMSLEPLRPTEKGRMDVWLGMSPNPPCLTATNSHAGRCMDGMGLGMYLTHPVLLQSLSP